MKRQKEYHYKIAVIIPYFGKLPNNYSYWEKTVLKNDSIDFIIFTDNDIETKGNIRIIKMTFNQYLDNIKKNIHFPIVCSSPYKLCDFKPVIGVVWSELLKSYDFWGYCDIDLLFGDIRKFITDDILDKYEKIFITAHFSLYRNIEKMNTLFMNSGEYPEYNFEEAFTTEAACYFDEFRGMELKCLRNEINVYHNSHVFLDMKPSRFEFKNRKGEKVFCIWNDGQLITVNACGQKEEWLYIHFQKRKISCDITNSSNHSFVMAPNYIRDNSDDEKYRLTLSTGIVSCIYTINYYKNRMLKNLRMYSVDEIVGRKKREKAIKDYKRKLLEKVNL